MDKPPINWCRISSIRSFSSLGQLLQRPCLVGSAAGCIESDLRSGKSGRQKSEIDLDIECNFWHDSYQPFLILSDKTRYGHGFTKSKPAEAAAQGVFGLTCITPRNHQKPMVDVGDPQILLYNGGVLYLGISWLLPFATCSCALRLLWRRPAKRQEEAPVNSIDFPIEQARSTVFLISLMRNYPISRKVAN